MKDIVRQRQKGAVSLFVVIFAALLITIVTVGFIRIMIQNQQQATAADLSLSALDSAHAGVEDGKRALLRYQTMCNNDATTCVADSKINSATCNEAVLELTDVQTKKINNEISVQTTGDSGALNQYYTCVLINTDTVDYPGSLSKDESEIIPLKAVGPFDTVRLQWFRSDDIGASFNKQVKLDSSGNAPLLSVNSWALNTPPIMRTQLIQFSSNGFNLNDFNNADVSGNSNANTLFLYPSGVGSPNANFATDARRDVNPASPGSPVIVKCSNSVVLGGYACTTDLKLPTQINGGDRTAFLRIMSLYNGAHYRVTLFNGAIPVNFNGVLPSIDSTGRADDRFRRVQVRVKLSNDFPYPQAEIDTNGNLCKNFMVTNDPAQYVSNSDQCTP